MKADWMKHNAHSEFNKWADSYDHSIINRLLFDACHRKLIEQVRRVLIGCGNGRPLRLLDVGCGTAVLLGRLISSTDGRLYGVGLDLAQAMLRNARDRAERLRLTTQLCFTQADSEHLPFASESFDLVTCANSFHHYPDQQRAVREMHRVLRPGGRLMIADGNIDHGLGWVIFDVFVNLIEGGVRHRRSGEMREIFLRAGFTDVRQERFNHVAPVLLTMGTAVK